MWIFIMILICAVCLSLNSSAIYSLVTSMKNSEKGEKKFLLGLLFQNIVMLFSPILLLIFFGLEKKNPNISRYGGLF